MHPPFPLICFFKCAKLWGNADKKKSRALHIHRRKGRQRDISYFGENIFLFNPNFSYPFLDLRITFVLLCARISKDNTCRRLAFIFILQKRKQIKNRSLYILCSIGFELCNIEKQTLVGSVSFTHQKRIIKVQHYIYNIYTLKNPNCVSRKGIARPQSQFLHSCVCERFIYSRNRSFLESLFSCIAWENSLLNQAGVGGSYLPSSLLLRLSQEFT